LYWSAGRFYLEPPAPWILIELFGGCSIVIAKSDAIGREPVRIVLSCWAENSSLLRALKIVRRSVTLPSV
jgi:hypothetical protein